MQWQRFALPSLLCCKTKCPFFSHCRGKSPTTQAPPKSRCCIFFGIQDSEYPPHLSGRYSSISSIDTSKNLHKASRTSKEIAVPFPLDNLKAVAYAMLALRIRSVAFKPRCLSNSGTLTLITDSLLRNKIWRICAKAWQKAELSTILDIAWCVCHNRCTGRRYTRTALSRSGIDGHYPTSMPCL